MEPQSQGTTLRPFVESLAAGDPMGHLNLTLVPLRGPGRGQVDYVLAAEAIAAGMLQVTEVSQSGIVSELLAVNTARQGVLLLDGEQLVGAKQNRILNTTVLLPAESKTRIPVSCVEQGRWRHTAPGFVPGGHAPTALRAETSRAVSENLRDTGRAVSDQQAVWATVHYAIRALGGAPPTGALHDAMVQRRDSLDAYVKALAWPDGARGVIAAVGGRLAAVDVFDRPETLRGVWSRLVTGYATDALVQADAPPRPFTDKGARMVLERLGETACERYPAAGAGETWRFDSRDLHGQALVVEGVCVHLSAFPPPAMAGPGLAERAISPPSRRARGGRTAGEGGSA